MLFEIALRKLKAINIKSHFVSIVSVRLLNYFYAYYVQSWHWQFPFFFVHFLKCSTIFSKNGNFSKTIWFLKYYVLKKKHICVHILEVLEVFMIYIIKLTIESFNFRIKIFRRPVNFFYIILGIHDLLNLREV